LNSGDSGPASVSRSDANARQFLEFFNQWPEEGVEFIVRVTAGDDHTEQRICRGKSDAGSEVQDVDEHNRHFVEISAYCDPVNVISSSDIWHATSRSSTRMFF
jgi:hypothetical protein